MATTTRKTKRKQQEPAAQLSRLRTSERTTLKACEFRWWLTYEQKLQPITAAPALRFGSLIHGALAAYYKVGTTRGPHPAKTFRKLYAKELAESSKMGWRDEEGTWQDAAELGEAMMNNYIDEYGADDQWEVLATELPFSVTVYRPDGTSWFNYVGVLDGAWRNRSNKRIWIPDHKTTAGIGGSVDHPHIPPYLQMDDQAGAYWSFGVEYLVYKEFLRQSQKLAGMLYNFMRKAKPDERPYKLHKGHKLFLNKDNSISKTQPSPYFARFPIMRDEYDRNQVRQRTDEEFRRIELLRSGELTPTKSPGMFTCPSCSVRDICELHETGNDWESMLTSTMRPWDPYAQHEIKEGR